MKRFPEIIVTTTLLLLFAAGPAAAASVSVAVAANFLQPMEKLAALFTARTGIKVEYSSSSTGKLYAQLKNGAPYDIFLAADEKRPELLDKAGLTTEPMIYARGQVVLWTKEAALQAADWQQALTVNKGRIAIASPEVAPYGMAASAALKKTGLDKTMASRLVFAQSVGQAFQYGQQGATRFCFAALSYAASDTGNKGRYWPISEAPLVVQKGCLLKTAADKEAAQRFWDFLFSKPANAIKAAYGYQ